MIHCNLCTHCEQPKQERKKKKKNRKEKKNCFTNILYRLIPPHLITDVPCAGNFIILK